jgi:hypothetical protein
MIFQKTCTKCQNLKNISEFKNDKRLKSGKGSVCLQCTRQEALNRRNKDPEKARKSFQSWAQKNKEYNSQRKTKWAKNNPDRKKESDKRYVSKNVEKVRKRAQQYAEKNKEKVAEKSRLWRKANLFYVLSKNAFRRAAVLKRTPGWLTEEDKRKMDEIYKECRKKSKETGVSHHVDHYYPLLGETVCGLHVPLNLRIIMASENVKKKNRIPDDDDSSQT